MNVDVYSMECQLFVFRGEESADPPLPAPQKPPSPSQANKFWRSIFDLRILVFLGFSVLTHDFLA